MFTNSYYYAAEKKFATRRSGREYKRISKNQVLLYDKRNDCYIHKHHYTNTVFIYRDKFVIDTGGWNTETTWKKIGQWSPLRAGGKRVASWEGTKYVYWDNHTYATEYYDGIEIDNDGVPLDPKPIKVRRLRRGVTKPIRDITKQVLHALGPRAAVGEFDRWVGKQVDGAKLVALVTDIAEWLYDHPSQVLVPDEFNWQALFARRERMSFGSRAHHQYDDEPTSLQRLKSNLAAAVRVWLNQQTNIYETVEKPCNYWSKP